MALTGHLSDLSLSELIEFFCNQRKTGQLKVLYPQGQGFFYLQSGSVVDARIGALRGIDAVYFALTLPNAHFEFGALSEPIERTINQPWTQVVLEGLRRLDEGLIPSAAFPADYEKDDDSAELHEPETEFADPENLLVPPFLSSVGQGSTGKRKFLITGAIAVVVLASVAAIGLPAGWYARRQPPAAANQSALQPTVAVPKETPLSTETTEASNAEAVQPTEASLQGNEEALAAKRYRDMQRAKAREEKAALSNQAASLNQGSPGSAVLSPANTAADSAKAGPRKITVTVAYDESGRVTQASGGDASAVRIARQKRFPAGKAGSATITIPIN
jgi:hypothetical protein